MLPVSLRTRFISWPPSGPWAWQFDWTLFWKRAPSVMPPSMMCSPGRSTGGMVLGGAGTSVVVVGSGGGGTNTVVVVGSRVVVGSSVVVGV